ncbi:MAG: tRNA (N(6)-L-threonylcarbamoyladenosine(37)-C(2))-methylthiotransferase MtaB [Bacilli bacterium]|nr:tRNA (N(6)-L-threonylcarbamoyladenosine(37)-C(2))-methylthiotransferase MtaB [Bacilli bacterium]
MKFYIYNLGCKVNAYETNVMKDNLINNGFTLSNEENADIIIINSCTVTNTADNKTMKLIRHVRNKTKAIIVVVGCFIQVHKDDLSFIDADILLGNKNKSIISSYIKKYLKEKKRIEDIYNIETTDFEKMCLNNYDHTRAFIKIQDGCNNFCSYCIIPYSRGGVRSKNKDEVINEVKTLIKNGHKEIVLTGIHTGNYGVEFKNYDFACLLCDLVKIEGLERLRISSIEITEINERVMNIIKNNKILVDHMHIPLQSGSNEILKNMNRKYDMNYFIDKINKLKKIRPNISITTDVIVGFPGETETLFEETINNIKKIGFTKLHVFPYSKRNGTKACTMENQVTEEVKKKRSHTLLNLSKELEINYMNKFINKKTTFIPEIEKDGYLIGHTGNYLLIKCKGTKLVHNSINITITKIEYPYCIAQIN